MMAVGGAGPLGMMLTPWVKRLMIATAVMSIGWVVLARWFDIRIPIAFSPNDVIRGVDVVGFHFFALWEFITYPFLIGEPIGLLLGLAMYGWFGGALESIWGSQRFARHFLLLVVGPALGTLLLAFVWPALSASVVAGPYAAFAGLVVAWGLTFPNQEIRLFFVLPVRGLHLVWFELGFLALNILFAGAVHPFVPHILGTGLGFAIARQLGSVRLMGLQLRKLWVASQLKREQRRRADRARRSGLRVVDRDRTNDDKTLH